MCDTRDISRKKYDSDEKVCLSNGSEPSLRSLVDDARWVALERVSVSVKLTPVDVWSTKEGCL